MLWAECWSSDAISLCSFCRLQRTHLRRFRSRRLPELIALGYPILLGASRKSMIAKLLNLKDPKARLNGTLATTAFGIQSGVDFIRVHDVRENRECADVVDCCVRF